MKLKIAGLIIFAVLLAGCNKLENDSTSGSMLQIVSLTGNDLNGKAGSTTVFSDVETGGSIFNDSAVAAVMSRPIDPLGDPANLTPYMDVLVDQIDVSFKRTDGRNQEGVDVPMHFTQPMSMLATIGKTTLIPFMLIRHAAKLEAPLLALNLPENQGKILELVAVVTIHGKDMGGNRVVPVTGYVPVWCSNFADATTPAPTTSTVN